MSATWRIEVADCVEYLRTFPENSVDSCVTDPPYGLEFMGKEWDRLGGDVVDDPAVSGGARSESNSRPSTSSSPVAGPLPVSRTSSRSATGANMGTAATT